VEFSTAGFGGIQQGLDLLVFQHGGILLNFYPARRNFAGFIERLYKVEVMIRV
jgi:hypothetical protein